MPIGPPARRLSSELAIAALIFVGALSASVLVAMICSSLIIALIQAIFHVNDEGLFFLQPAVITCAALLLNPGIFIAVASNHCRKVPRYFVVVTPVPWLLNFFLLWRYHQALASEPLAVAVCALGGFALAWWILQRKEDSFRAQTSNPL